VKEKGPPSPFFRRELLLGGKKKERGLSTLSEKNLLPLIKGRIELMKKKEKEVPQAEKGAVFISPRGRLLRPKREGEIVIDPKW